MAHRRPSFFASMGPRSIAKTGLALVISAIVACSVKAAPYQDRGPVLKSFDGTPYEAVLTGEDGNRAQFGLRQISPYQMVAMRGRVLVVFGTKKEAKRNELSAREEAGRWMTAGQPSPNWPPPEIQIVRDVDVKDADLARQDIILIGTDESNAVTARLTAKMPVRVAKSSVVLGKHGTLDSVSAGRFIFPNPLNKSHFVMVSFGSLDTDPDDIRWSVAYRWTAALSYFWNMTDYSFITRDGTIRGGYFAKTTRTDWKFDPKLTITVPNAFRDPYKEWKTRQTQHFTFHYAPHSAAEERISALGAKWDQDWESLYAETSRVLDQSYDRRINVFLFNEWEDAGRYAALGFSPISAGGPKAAGLTDARFGVVLLMGRENAVPSATARHEVAHILAEKIAPPTVGFNAEGWACAAEGDRPSQAAGKSLCEWETDYLRVHSAFPPLSALLRPQGFSAYPPCESYPIAASFTGFLIGKYGMLKYKDYYKAATQGDPEASLQQVYGKTTAEIEKQWMAQVRSDCQPFMKAVECEDQANSAYCKRDFGLACELAAKAVKLNPKLTLAYFILGASCNRKTPYDAAGALGALQKYQQKLQQQGQPEQPWTYVEMGYANDLKGDREKALFWYDKAVRLPDDRGSQSEAQRRLMAPFRRDDK